jgi:hypothetical protein
MTLVFGETTLLLLFEILHDCAFNTLSFLLFLRPSIHPRWLLAISVAVYVPTRAL